MRNLAFLALASILALTVACFAGSITGAQTAFAIFAVASAAGTAMQLRASGGALGVTNAFDSALVTDIISTKGLEILQNRLAPLNLFASDFSDQYMGDGSGNGRALQVTLATGAGATSVNPATFEPGNVTTLGKATVTLDHLVQFFHIDASEMAQGFRLERLIGINAEKLADKIWSVAITPITTTNYGAAVVTTTVITPGGAPLKTLWENVSKASSKGLVVSANIYAQLIPTSMDNLAIGRGAYGFEGGIFYASSFTGAVAGLDGFACSQEAVAIAGAQPMIPDAVAQQFLLRQQFSLERLGMSVWLNVWGSTSNRRVNATLELMFGSAKGIGEAEGGGAMALII